VIEQTIRQKLPEGFQRAEFLLEHGMLDMVVDRRNLKATLVKSFKFLAELVRHVEAVALKRRELHLGVVASGKERRILVSCRALLHRFSHMSRN
jgi:hypothetical protein